MGVEFRFTPLYLTSFKLFTFYIYLYIKKHPFREFPHQGNGVIIICNKMKQ